MGWNLQVNSAHHGFRSGWVEIFLQISIRVDFRPGSSRTRFIRVESMVSQVGQQPANKRVTQVFFIKLGFTFVLGCFLSQHINNLYFFILVCIWIILKFI